MLYEYVRRIYIIGAGLAGIAIASEIRRKKVLGEVSAFLDDDGAKIGSRIDDIPVIGPIDSVLRLLERRQGDEILIAMPTAPRERISEICQILNKLNFDHIRLLPAASQILDGDAHLILTRKINPQDLLRRNSVSIDLRDSVSYLNQKRVLITGAGGAIGGELARQLLSSDAERIYLFGHGENSIYEIDRDLRLLQQEGVGKATTIVPIIGELQDFDFISFLIRRLRADVIFHAAAYKHVPLMEQNPVGAVANNVLGTANLVTAARSHGVCRLVLISTDKAVDPISVYGATKRIAEDIALNASDSRCVNIVVRFGNVLGSRGSFVPLFQQQIANGGPVTVTDIDASRYFMTISEASSLVLRSGGMGDRGGLYLLEMGEPISIISIAEQMIRFSGLEPHSQIAIDYIGLRPGEKLRERLHSDNERRRPTEHAAISLIERPAVDGAALDRLLNEIRDIVVFDPKNADRYRDHRRLRKIIRRYVPTLPMDDLAT